MKSKIESALIVIAALFTFFLLGAALSNIIDPEGRINDGFNNGGIQKKEIKESDL